jgi:hypothetical protein
MIPLFTERKVCFVVTTQQQIRFVILWAAQVLGLERLFAY